MRGLAALPLLVVLACARADPDYPIKTGMTRAQVEGVVAARKGLKSKYSPYGADLAKGGLVEYADGKTTLEVDYAPGVPAPWVTGKDGTAVHYPPVDQTVKNFRVRRK